MSRLNIVLLSLFVLLLVCIVNIEIKLIEARIVIVESATSSLLAEKLIKNGKIDESVDVLKENRLEILRYAAKRNILYAWFPIYAKKEMDIDCSVHLFPRNDVNIINKYVIMAAKEEVPSSARYYEALYYYYPYSRVHWSRIDKKPIKTSDVEAMPMPE